MSAGPSLFSRWATVPWASSSSESSPACLARLVAGCVIELGLHAAEEALHGRVVPAISLVAHGATHAVTGEQIAQHATALSSLDTPGRRFVSRRCAATPARALKLRVRAGAQPPAWSSLALEEVRSPLAPQMRDTGRTAASLMAKTSPVACRLPLGTILLLQAATSQHGLQHPHSPCLSRLPPRTVGALRVLPQGDDLVRTMAPDQTDPNAACASSNI